MCTIAGLAQGWWTVVGLVLDIAGFALLALDVGREYLRHLRSVELEQAAVAAEWLIKDRDRVPPPVDETIDETIDGSLRAARKEVRDLQRRLKQTTIRLAGMRDDQPGKTGGKQSLEEKVLEFRTLAKETPLQPFKRAPIFTGIFFVILGFVLQVLGAIPCS